MINEKAFRQLSYGLSIVTSRLMVDGQEAFNGQVANAIFQVSSKPPVIAASINKDNLTHKYINDSRLFNITVLTENIDMEKIGLFGYKSGHEVNKFENRNDPMGENGIPLVGEGDDVSALFECRVISSIDVHTHTVFMGEVTRAAHFDQAPMTYAHFHKVKGMKSPKNAPTYIDDSEPVIEKGESEGYVCDVCGFEYNASGNSNIAWNDLPHDWICPVCGAERDAFSLQ
ncbi:MAG: flavin reductase [Planctomycetes bacterium]|nr:flavin reductase [Planctomycetota bacterium]